MADPIGDFMLITQCPDEGTAIQYLSTADFDVQTAVALYQSSQEDSPNVGKSGRSQPTVPSGTSRGVTSPPSGASSSPNYTSTGGGAQDFDYADYDYEDDGDNAYAAHGSAVDARDYNPQARQLMDTGVPRQAQLNKDLASVDDSQDFDNAFVKQHFGEIPIFRPPKWGCEGRYVYHGDDPSAHTGQYGQEANPIISRFKYCCAVAEKQRKFVFLLILRGERTFCDSCCVRDLLSKRSAAASFLQEHFLSFFQVVLPGALDHVRTTQLAKLQTNQPDVARMIHLSAFLSTYQIGTDARENLLPGGRVPGSVVTDDQRRIYNVFCNNPFPVIAIINPQTQSLVKRIPLGQLYRVRSAAAELDVDTLMEELTQALDSNLIDENFFLRRESTAGGEDSPSKEASPTRPKESSPPAQTTSNSNPQDGSTAPKYLNEHSSKLNSFNVDDGDDAYEYEYDYSREPSEQVAQVAAPPTSSLAGLSSGTALGGASNTTGGTVSPPPARSDGTPSLLTTTPPPHALASPTDDTPLVMSPGALVELDVAQYIGPVAVPSADCFKLRVQTPKGQYTVEFAKSTPLRLFCAYLTAICTPNKAGPALAGGAAATTFTFDAELRSIIGGTKFLGGFPPRPMDVPQDTVTDAIVGADGADRSVEAANAFLTEGPTLAEWGKIRTNDSIRPSLP